MVVLVDAVVVPLLALALFLPFFCLSVLRIRAGGDHHRCHQCRSQKERTQIPVNTLHVFLPGRDFQPEFPVQTPEWLTVHPRASSLKSQANKAKTVPGSCLFKFAHGGGGLLQKPKLPPVLPILLDTSPALASGLTD